MSDRIAGLRKDKDWLIGTVESLLEENEQLKKLLVGSSINWWGNGGDNREMGFDDIVFFPFFILSFEASCLYIFNS